MATIGIDIAHATLHGSTFIHLTIYANIYWRCSLFIDQLCCQNVHHPLLPSIFLLYMVSHHNCKVTGYALNIEYYFWWRDQCFWLINPLRRMALLHGQYQ